MRIAATPLGTKELTLTFTNSDFAVFGGSNMVSESVQRRGGSSLLTQAWERSTDT